MMTLGFVGFAMTSSLKVIFMSDMSPLRRHFQLLREQNRREMSSDPGLPCNRKYLNSDWDQYLDQKTQDEFNYPSWFFFLIS